MRPGTPGATSTGRPSTSSTPRATSATTHFGEGDYGASEAAIRSLLAERGAKIGAARAHAARHHAGRAADDPGDLRRRRARQGFAGTPPTSGTATYELPRSAPPLNGFALGGTWKIGDEAATARPRRDPRGDVQARFVYLVLSPPRPRPGAVTVRVDGKAPRRIIVDTQRLYTLASF